jgi:hypothetical protein
MSQDTLHDAIRRSGIFDAKFYAETYGHLFADGQDPLDYFVSVGLRQDHLPCAAFDPVLYRVLVPACGDTPPLLHFMAGNAAYRPPTLDDVFPAAASGIPKVKASPDLNVARNRAYAPHAMDIREMAFEAQGQRYVLKVPPPEALLGRIASERPFAYARLPHGYWDCLWQREIALDTLARDERTHGLTADQRTALATQLCDARYPASGGFTPMFLDEVLAEIPVHAANPDFLRAVAFAGYPTFKEVAVGAATPRGRALARLVAAHFKPGEALYDAMYWKRMLISGHLKVLPELCRARPVVLVASEYFSDLASRWRLHRFEHVCIPPSRSQALRRSLLERLRAALAAASAAGGSAPIVLMQCGGSLAFWLISRLYAEFPRAFYLDLGQALDGWFFDRHEIRVYRWMKVYTRSVIEHCGLEPYYRELKGASYDEWFRGLP